MNDYARKILAALLAKQQLQTFFKSKDFPHREGQWFDCNMDDGSRDTTLILERIVQFPFNDLEQYVRIKPDVRYLYVNLSQFKLNAHYHAVMANPPETFLMQLNGEMSSSRNGAHTHLVTFEDDQLISITLLHPNR